MKPSDLRFDFLFDVFRKNTIMEIPFELAMRRMMIEICIAGGSVAQTLAHATHLVIVSSAQIDVDFDILMNR